MHEAVEALGNISPEKIIKLLDRFPADKEDIVYETCFLSKCLFEWQLATDNGKTEDLDLNEMKYYRKVDPAPPFNFLKDSKYKDVRYLQSIIMESPDFYEKYRALFTLREINTEESVMAICWSLRTENSRNCTALLKHWVCTTLMAMTELFKLAIPYLLECVANEEEH